MGRRLCIMCQKPLTRLCTMREIEFNFLFLFCKNALSRDVHGGREMPSHC